MYLNVFQRYMKELIDEYGPLLKRQLLIMVNFHIGSRLKNIDGYAFQMCQFGNFQTGRLGGDEYIGYKGEMPNIDMIRSVDVMLAFLPNVRQHRKSSGLVSIKFLAGYALQNAAPVYKRGKNKKRQCFCFQKRQTARQM